MHIRFAVAMFCIVCCSVCTMHAQKGAIFSPSGVTYGLGLSSQSGFATGFGLTSSAHVSILDFMRKGMEVETGFKVRDIFGAHCNLGLRVHPDPQMVGTYLVSSTSKVWYDVGFDYAGIQFLYGFNEELWLSLKGQLYAGWNNASYYEIFSSTFSTSTVTLGTQVGPFSAEIGQGWEAFQHHGPNYLTFAGAFRFQEKNTTYNMFGFRFVRHTEYVGSVMVSPTEFVPAKHKSFSFSLFYAHCI